MPKLSPGAVVRSLSGVAAALTRQQTQGQVLTPSKSNTLIAGIEPTNWPSALQPVQPLAPRGAQALAIQLQQGQNLNLTPRPDSEYPAAELKEMSTYLIARLAIEQVKNLISEMPWQIATKRLPGESERQRHNRERSDENIGKLTSFFEFPNAEQDWTQFIRLLLEDLLVLDAPAILTLRAISKDGLGQIRELRHLPGESILRYVDDSGMTPAPPSPAYAQLWEGLPRLNFTTNQLVYRPRNISPRNSLSSQIYGFSPVEQMAKEIKIGQARLEFVFRYYSDGAVPGLIHVVPPDVDPKQIDEAMKWLNDQLAGNLVARQQWQMVQGFQKEGRAEQIIFSKEKALSDPFDDMHIRKICFGFGVSAQRLMKPMNRASAQVNQDASEEEGLAPYISWLKGTIDYLIQRQMGMAGYQWRPNVDEELDQKTLSEMDKVDATSGTTTINERRIRRGLLPVNTPEADMLGVVTPNGWQPIDMDTQLEFLQRKQEIAPGVSATTGITGADGKQNSGGAAKPAAKPKDKPSGKPSGVKKNF